MIEKMTVDEFFGLFGRSPEQVRWASYADAEEYLTLVTYLVARAELISHSFDATESA
jgi:hypothetical protein